MMMERWRIRGWGRFDHLASDAPQPLGAALHEAMPHAPRRLNRYASLALIGAQRCMRGNDVPLASDMPIYTASEQGPLAETVGLMQEILLRAQPLKPVPFINLSGNTGSFHIAASLGLAAANITVAREYGAFGALLELAALDAPERLLAGSVGECVWPLAEHRLRCGLAPDAPMAEGSYWLLLEACDDAATGPTLTYTRTSATHWVSDWLAAADAWATDPQLDPAIRAELARHLDPQHRLAAPLALEGYAQAPQHTLLHALDSGLSGNLRVVARDSSDAYQCFDINA